MPSPLGWPGPEIFFKFRDPVGAEWVPCQRTRGSPEGLRGRGFLGAASCGGGWCPTPISLALQIMESHFLFKHLDDRELAKVVLYMSPETYYPGQVLREGVERWTSTR